MNNSSKFYCSPFFNLVILLLLISTYTVSAQEWYQETVIRQGEAPDFNSVWYTNMSSDGNTIAVSEALAIPSILRVYRWNEGEQVWKQLGLDFQGEFLENFSVSLSEDGNTMAVGYPQIDDTRQEQVRIYTWNDSDWVQLGADLLAEEEQKNFGWSVDLSADGRRLIVGVFADNGSVSQGGSARVYDWDGSNWTQQGNTIYGVESDDQAGVCTRISANGMTIAVGAARNDANGKDAGQVRVFDWDGNNWLQRGADLLGSQENEYAGVSLDLSWDGNTIAISSPGAKADDRVSVDIYTWQNDRWKLKGATILGKANDPFDGWFNSSSRSTSTVSLSHDGNKVLLGDFRNDQHANNSGYVQLFAWNGSTWISENQIFGNIENNKFGWSLSMSGAGDRFVVSVNDGLQVYASSERIVGLEEETLIDLQAYPNPTNGAFQIQLEEAYAKVAVRVVNIMGQIVQEGIYQNQNVIDLELVGEAGYYVVEVVTDHQKASLMVLKN